jgi:DNA-binding beta-propeller fold protein YncE
MQECRDEAPATRPEEIRRRRQRRTTGAPDGWLALVVNSMDVQRDGDKFKAAPANQLYVIDLTANPPKLIDTVVVGKQGSGMSINRAGTLALTANRADNSVSVLRISSKKVEPTPSRSGKWSRTPRSRPTASSPSPRTTAIRGARTGTSTRSRSSTSRPIRHEARKP